jgi:hypothetical protein
MATLSDITTAQVKAYYKYTSTDRDAQIDIVRPIVVDMIKQICNNDFESKARTNEKPYIQPSRNEFYLQYYPIASITSLIEDGETLIEDEDFYVEKETGRIEKLVATDLTGNTIFDIANYWTTERNKIIVNYVGGDTLTQDVVLAFYEIVGIYTEINQKVFTDIEGNEHATAYDKIPTEIKDILARHTLRKYHV